MTVKELKKLLVDVPDEMNVYIPGDAIKGFTGAWFSPCTEETGIGELGLEDLDDDEIQERELLNKPMLTEKAFCIVPHGFFEKKPDPSVDLN